MNSTDKNSRYLGAAFLIQFVISISAMVTGILVKQNLMAAESLSKGLINIANSPWLMRANILGEIFTAVGLIVLGSFLFAIFKRKYPKVAGAAFGLYIGGAAILAATRIATYALFRISQNFAAGDQSRYLITIARLVFESSEYGITLIGLPLCLGLMLFYYLFYKSRVIPRVLSIWGFLTSCLLMIAALFPLFDQTLPIYIYLPYVPVEIVMGVWILLKGLKPIQEVSHD